jgi:hypothetical protein
MKMKRKNLDKRTSPVRVTVKKMTLSFILKPYSVQVLAVSPFGTYLTPTLISFIPLVVSTAGGLGYGPVEMILNFLKTNYNIEKEYFTWQI